MRKNFLFMAAASAMAFFTACSSETNNDTPHPGDNLFGTYDMSCDCQVQSQSGTSNATVDFSLQIAEIPGDSAQLELLNLHNLGQSHISEINSANSFSYGEFPGQGTIINNVLTLNYSMSMGQNYYNCTGTGTKQ